MLRLVDDSSETVMTGRVATIMRWLAANVERVTLPQKIQITFDCAGASVSAEVKERERVKDPKRSQ
jgi:hypothetical protein